MKNKFQRIGVLLCACLFAFCGVLVLSVSASVFSDPDYLSPMGFLFHDQLTYAGESFEAPISFTFTTQNSSAIATDSNYARIDEIGIAFGLSSEVNDYVYKFGDGWQVDGPLYIYVDSLSDDDIVFLYEALVPYGTFYSIRDSYVFALKPSVFTGFISYDFQFVSNGFVFTRLYSMNEQIYYGQVGDSVSDMTLVFDNGIWLNESYRFLTLGRYVPERLVQLRFFEENEFVPPSFLDRVTSGLTAVIGWVGVVASAVISGPLSPLLGLVAVGIAVSAILLVIYLVRRFIWGS